MQTHTAQVLGTRGQGFELNQTEVLPIYPSVGGFAPSLAQNARALGYLLRENQADLWHFVFAPNPKASGALRWLRRIRTKPALQTIASPPRSFDNIEKLLFGDLVVAQSEWTRRQIEAALSRPRELLVIRPPLGDVPVPDAAAEQEMRERLEISAGARVIVYPGDLEFSGGAERFARMAEGFSGSGVETVFVFACRRKTSRAIAVEADLQARLDPARVRFAGELPSLLPLLKTASCVAFPVEDLWGKVDIPIALLETAQLGVPLLVAENGPAGEIAGAAALPLDDTGAWLQALERLDSGSEYRARVISEQIQGLDNTHRAGLVAARYEALYEQLRR